MRKTSANPKETLPPAEWPGSTKVGVVTIEGYHLRRRGLQWGLARSVSGLIRFLAAVVDAVATWGGTRIVSSAQSVSPRARFLATAAALLMLAGLFPAAVGAAPPSGAPTLLAPADEATVSSNPVFSWSAVSGAAKYRVQISADPVDFTPLVYTVDTVNRKATPPADLPLGVLHWRVAGTDGGSGVGPFSPARSFTKEWGTAPIVDAPIDGVTLNFPSQPVLFDWQPLAGAKSYTLEIDNEPGFNVPTTFTTNNTNFTLTEPQTIDTIFYWRLRATSSTGGVVSEWTSIRSYTYDWTTIPTLLTPANDLGIEVQDIVFSWQPVQGAASYQLQVSSNGDWANNTGPGRAREGHQVLTANDAQQRRLLLARPGKGREEPCQQWPLVG